MINRHSRQKLKNRLRNRKKQVADVSLNANKQLDRHVFRRLHNLKEVKRFMFGWLVLMSLVIVVLFAQIRVLGSYYLFPQPVNGGVYNHGVVGTFTNANPIYATGNVDSLVSELVFASLFRYDKNNQLVGDLAGSYKSDEKGQSYTVRLKPGLKWHDGNDINADDVIFTIKTIQNPDARSPLRVNWVGVEVEKVSELSVKFNLPSAYVPFPHSLTIGILPQHLLKDIPATELRSSLFNTKQPIGSGPFIWQSINSTGSSASNDLSQTIQLSSFRGYNGKTTKLDGMTIQTFADIQKLKDAYTTKKIIGAHGLSYYDAKSIDANSLKGFSMTTTNMLFLKNSSPILSDAKVRQAITNATNTKFIVANLDYPAVTANSPLLKSHLGYNKDKIQLPYNQAESNRLLTEAGWILPEGKKIREKEGKPLDLTFVTEDDTELKKVTSIIKKQWLQIGVNLKIVYEKPDAIIQNYISVHNYDVLLYGISLGADPDVYPYWHSKQIDIIQSQGLNLAEYKSATADLALEGGRTRVDPALRTAKYATFLDTWRVDAPGIALYQPKTFFISNQKIYGMDISVINNSTEIFKTSENWMINTEKQKLPYKNPIQ